MRLALLIAGRYLRARKGDGFVSVLVWFSLIGIMLGVATLIIVMSVMNGFRHDLQTRILGLNGHLSIESASGIQNYDQLSKTIADHPDVLRVAPMIDQQVLVVGNNRVTGAMARGLLAQGLMENPLISNALSASVDDFDARSDVIIGERMAWSLGLSLGDSITLMAPQANRTAFGSSPRRKTYRIGGTFEVGMSEYDSSYLFMPLAQAQKLFRMPERVLKLELSLHEPDKAVEIAQALEPIVFAAVSDARLNPWQYRHASFFQALKVERNVMFLILSLVVMIAAFNIIISQVMMVRDKAGSIAILRAVGASRHLMMSVFFCTGALIGGIGTALGVGIGIAFALNIEDIRTLLEALLQTEVFSPEIYYLSTLPSRLETNDMINIVSLALGLTFCASLYAAWQAVRLDPVQVLRHAR